MDRVEAVVVGAGVALAMAGREVDAFKRGKHVVLMNAELDATIGPGRS